MLRYPFLFGASVLALVPALSPAQVTPAPADPLPSIPLPSPTPTPAPTPSPTPEPSDTPTPEPTPTPTPSATPTRPAGAPAARPTPRATPTSTPTPEPVTTPEPTPTPTSTPTPTATPAPIETVVLPAQPRAPLWPWLAGAALLLLSAALLLFRRRAERVEAEEPFAPEPEYSPEPPVTPPRAARARLAIAVRPTRAGFNLMTATVDNEVTVTNTGDAPARDIRVAVGLQSARADAGELLADFAARPVIRPATPPFALAPGEERRFRAVAALAHDAIRPVTAAGRPMFAPLVAVSAGYRDDTGERQAAQAFAVGLERADSAKLAPLWLDVPPRSYDNVAARPHEEMLER